MDQDKFKFSKDRMKKGFYIALIIAGGLALAVAFFFLIYNFKEVEAFFGAVMTVLRPFIIGAVIAYILKSTCNAYEKLITKGLMRMKKVNVEKVPKRANVIAVVLTYLTWFIVIGVLLWIAIPQIYDSIYNFVSDLIQNMPTYIDTVTLWISDIKAAHPQLAPHIDSIGATLYDWVNNWMKSELTPMLPQIGKDFLLGVIDAFNIIKDVIIGLVISVFFLAGRKTFARKAKLFVDCIFKEKHANTIVREVKFADRMFSGFLEGKIIDSAIIAIIYYIALTIMGIDYAALLALICGVTNIIPFFGPFLGAIPSAFIILMSHSDEPLKLLYFIIFVCVIQFIDGNIIDPHIVGANIQISPFCVIFAVLFFGGLWGFTGLILGVPLFAVIYDIVKQIVYARLIKAGKKDVLRNYFKESGRKSKKASANGAPAVDVANEGDSVADARSEDPSANENKCDAAGSDGDTE